MNQKQLADALRALETFDKAAQNHGWQQDQGSERDALRAQRLYKAAKARLINMLKDIAAGNGFTLERPIVKLEDAERAALREAFDAHTTPPAAPEPHCPYRCDYCQGLDAKREKLRGPTRVTYGKK